MYVNQWTLNFTGDKTKLLLANVFSLMLKMYNSCIVISFVKVACNLQPYDDYIQGVMWDYLTSAWT